MSVVVQLSNSYDASIEAACRDTAGQTLAALAEHFNFDVDEATRFLKLDDLKVTRKRASGSKKAAVKKSETKKTKQSSSEPKKAKTGYNLWQIAEETKAAIKTKMSDDSLGNKKATSILWKELGDADGQKAWNDKADTLKLPTSSAEASEASDDDDVAFEDNE